MGLCKRGWMPAAVVLCVSLKVLGLVAVLVAERAKPLVVAGSIESY